MTTTQFSPGDLVAVQESFGRALFQGDVIGRFYEILLASHPDIPPMFHKTNFSKQRELLTQGINLMVLYAKGKAIGKSGLNRIRYTHNKSHYNIHPNLYKYWKESLIKTLLEFDEKINPEILISWNKVIDHSLKYIMEGYYD